MLLRYLLIHFVDPTFVIMYSNSKQLWFSKYQVIDFLPVAVLPAAYGGKPAVLFW